MYICKTMFVRIKYLS